MALLAYQRQATSHLLEDLLKMWVNQSFGCPVNDPLAGLIFKLKDLILQIEML